MLKKNVLTPEESDLVRRLLAEVSRHDGVAPLDEAALLRLAPGDTGAQHFLLPQVEVDGENAGEELAGYVSLLADGTIQGAVAPAQRRRGFGQKLLGAAHAQAPQGGAWAHGALPESAAFMAQQGWVANRELLVMSADPAAALRALETNGNAALDTEGLYLRESRGEADLELLHGLNAAAFADHPEQGKLSVSDLRQRFAQPWFSAARLLFAFRACAGQARPEPAGEESAAGGMTPIGFVWLKEDELYVLGVHPAAQGAGAGRKLLAAALRLAADEALPELKLYVDAANTAAVSLYKKAGFQVVESHTRYVPGA
ncbi:mycothiol synthase [Dermabacteraceae bacterium TAE3-ERU27]|nr:mycothiol synthase [Dermabacteraceae bacterium TAE3-ERU27]